jgi:polysaccharide export outer membrane protein
MKFKVVKIFALFVSILPAFALADLVDADTEAGLKQKQKRQQAYREMAVSCFEQQHAKQYQVAAGDVLRVGVWGEAELARELKVRPDGSFQFPLAGEIVAAGSTVKQIKNRLAKQLARFIPDAEVSVTVIQSAQSVFVLGKVNRPVEVPLDQPLSVLQALTIAGGMTPYAKTGDIKVVRVCDGEKQSYLFDYSEVSQGRKLEQDIALLNGDVIVVP